MAEFSSKIDTINLKPPPLKTTKIKSYKYIYFFSMEMVELEVKFGLEEFGRGLLYILLCNIPTKRVKIKYA
jgi:hypothetical protein